MNVVDSITIIKGTDRQFDLRIKKSNGDDYPLTDANLALTLRMPGDTDDLQISLVANANASLLALANATSGRLTVTLGDADTALLKRGDGLDMELTIQEGAGPDFKIQKVQFPGALTVRRSLFE